MRGSAAQQIHPRSIGATPISWWKSRATARSGAPTLTRRFDRMNVDTLLIGGVWSNVCVESTARDALFREYKVVYLADCTATGDLPDTGFGRVSAAVAHRATLADIAWHIGEVAYSQDVAARLLAHRPESG